MIKYYGLFDLLNRKGKKLSDLRNILSSATVAKLKKGEYISGEAIEKICIYLDCQPGDIMEVVNEIDAKIDGKKAYAYTKKTMGSIYSEITDQPEEEVYLEEHTKEPPQLFDILHDNKSVYYD